MEAGVGAGAGWAFLEIRLLYIRSVVTPPDYCFRILAFLRYVERRVYIIIEPSISMSA